MRFEIKNDTLETRLQKLSVLCNSRKKAVLYFTDRENAFQARYRCKNIASFLENDPLWGSVYCFTDEIHFFQDYIQDCSIVVFARVKWSVSVEQLITNIRKSKIPVVFDMDDLFCTMEDALIPMAANADRLNTLHRIAEYNLAIQRCDYLLVTNDYLGQCLQSAFHKPFFTIPNSLCREQIDVSGECVQRKTKIADRFIIGYFSGTTSHRRDFHVVSEALLHLLNDLDNVSLRICGHLELPEAFRAYKEAGRVEQIRFTDYLTLQSYISQVDVNIVPLEENKFTNCKSELKFFESAIVKVPTVATPVYSYKNAINDGKTGLLASEDEWYDKIRQLYEHPALAAEIAENACSYCIKEYYEKMPEKIAAAYQLIMDLHEQ